MQQIVLGDKVQDKVSGFEGIALARMTAIYEATQLRVHPTELNSENKIIDSTWIEETRLEKIAPVKHESGFRP
jgi:hypothetical protein